MQLLFKPEIWIPASLLLAIGFAIWNYLPLFKRHIPRRQVFILFSFRVVAAFLICLLLAQVFITTWTNYYEKPVVWVAVDRSASMMAGADSQWCKSELPQLLKSIQSQSDINCRVFAFGAAVKTDSNEAFKDFKTNLQQVFQYIEQDPGQTPEHLVIISDGIVNDGGDPRVEAAHALAQIDCIGVGDTALYPDAWISHVICNSTAKTQNTFNVEAEFRISEGLSSVAEISIWEGSQLRGRKTCTLLPGQRYSKITFSMFENQAGTHSYTVKLNPLPNEQKQYNNQFAFSVNVINTRLNVILAYQAPHPDIPVFTEWFKQSDGMQFDAIPINALQPEMLKGKLILFHGLKTTSHPLMDYCAKNSIPYWEIQCRDASEPAVMAEVFIHSGFKAFPITDPKGAISSILDPVVQIFPENKTDISSSHIILNASYQNQLLPVMYFTRELNTLRGHLCVDGIWKWNLQEGIKHEGLTLLRDLFLQAFQYSALSIRNERFNLRVPDNLNAFEAIELQAEVYDRIYNFNADAKVSVDIGNAKEQHHLDLLPINNQYLGDISNLAAGQYSYVAKAKCADTVFIKQGTFTVHEQAREMQNLQADLTLLKQISAFKNGTTLHHPTATDFLKFWNTQRRFKPVVHSMEHDLQLIDFKVLCLIILGVLTTEWILRKKWMII